MRKNRPVIELPRIIDIQYNAIDNTLDTLNRLNLKGKALIVADDITKKIAGQRVFEIIENSFEVDMKLISSSTLAESENIRAKLVKDDYNFVLAVGGGTVIDVSKYSSYQSKIPFISIPTVASHDGIASARASLVGTDTKHSFKAHSPIAVIGDVETISKAPSRFRISGSADLLSNKTAILDWELSHRVTGEHISQYAVALSEITAQTIIESADIIAKDSVEGTYIVFKGLITSSMAMCIAGSSRPASGAEHMISHMLDTKTMTKGLHGEQCGLASVLTMFLHGGDWKELHLALKTLGSPISIDQMGISKTEMIDALIGAQNIRKDRFSILSGGLSKIAATNVIEATRTG